MDTSLTRQREIDNVLVRMPASVHELAASAATADNISKNAFFATAVLEVALAHAVYVLGHPENVRHFIATLDGALREDFPAMGAFRRLDWNALTPIIKALADAGILSDVRAKPDARDADLVVYSLMISKLGRSIWPRISARLLFALSKTRQEMLPYEVYDEAAASSSSG